MSEWWTYRFSDFLLFSPTTYYRLFELYNQAIWPWQVVGPVAGIALLGLISRPGRWSGKAAAVLLAGCWLWVAWGYHHTQYATINWAADYLAAAFAVQAALLLGLGVVADGMGCLRSSPRRRMVGGGMLLFAIALQPLIGPALERSWMAVELFGLTPDPTVIGTLGVLVAAERRQEWLWVVPLAWCAAGGATLWTMESPDALLLPLVGLVAIILACRA